MTKEKYNPRELELSNIGPVEHLKLVAEPGKITVLKGPNGSGKSTVLNAADRALTGKKGKVGALTSRDGTTGGQFDFGGVRIKVARGGTNRAAGELEILSVESDLNIADFVDPGIKSEDAADAKRTKALIVLTGAKADESLFYRLFKGGKDEFVEMVSPEAWEADDLLEMAGKIKRDIEKHARAAEDQASNVSSEARALRDLIEGIDTEAESDPDLLEARTESARDALSAIRERKKWFDENRDAYAKAKESLSAAAEDPHDITIQISNAEAAAYGYENEIAELQKQIDEMQLKKAELRHKKELAEQQKESLVKSLESVKQNAAQRESLAALVAKFEAEKEPTADEVLSYVDGFEEAKAARDKGVKIREAKEKVSKIAEYETRKKELERRADDLRTAAKGTEDVLAEVVKKSCSSLKVDEQFRLIAKHPKRGECYFSELSEGERWKIGIEIAIEAFKKINKPGLLILPQSSWESLDSANRKIVHDAIKGTDLAVLTAEATKEEMVSEEQKSLFAEVIE